MTHNHSPMKADNRTLDKSGCGLPPFALAARTPLTHREGLFLAEVPEHAPGTVLVRCHWSALDGESFTVEGDADPTRFYGPSQVAVVGPFPQPEA